MIRRLDIVSLPASLFVLCSLAGCSKSSAPAPVSTGLAELPVGTAIVVVTATTNECPTGGLTLETFTDTNRNGFLDSGETVVSRAPVCNGTKGDQGVGAGIRVETAAVGVCPAGGTTLTTFTDANNDGAQNVGETATSVSTICNGVNSVLTATAANGMQCLAGGTVYTTHVDGQSPSAAIVCNGVNGVDGSNAGIQVAAIGPALPGHTFTACHHDGLYIPDTSGAARGWLVLRHQSNGSEDQGIGTTGFNVWNADISDFNLVSETGGVTYCSLHWAAAEKRLDFRVVETTYGLAGQTGSVRY